MNTKVKQSETDAEDITGVDILLLIQFLVAVIALGLVAIGFQSIPVKPPSKAAARRVSLTQIKTMEQGWNFFFCFTFHLVFFPLRIVMNLMHFKKIEIKNCCIDQGTMSKCMTLLKNPNYQILLIIFSLCLGHLNALAALIGSIFIHLLHSYSYYITQRTKHIYSYQVNYQGIILMKNTAI